MITEELRLKLTEEARSKGCCEDGLERLSRLGEDDLAEYYKSIIDWSLERGFPGYEVLKEHFGDLERHGIYVGKTFKGEMMDGMQTYVFHKCKGTIKTGLNTEKGLIPMIYVANGCRLRIVGAGDYAPKNPGERSVVPLYISGSNDLSAKDNKYVRFEKYRINAAGASKRGQG